MTTIAALVTRVQTYLQDPTAEAWPLIQVEAQLRESMQALGRQQLLGDVTWQNVVAGEPEYTFDTNTIDFSEVLYDGRSLRPAQEDALTRLRRDWDRAEGTPQYYTVPLEPAETVQLIPMLHTSGSALEYVPPQTIAGVVEGNLVVFRWVSPEEVTVGEFPLQEVLEDVVVFLTVGALSSQNGEFHDKERGQSFEYACHDDAASIARGERLMAAPTSIDPLRILPTSDTQALAHDLNRVLDRITSHFNNRYGFAGPVAMHASVDFRGNPATNVSTSREPTNAATVEQLAQLAAQVQAMGQAIAGLVLRPTSGAAATAFVLLTDSPPGGYPGQHGKGVAVNASETALEFVAFALLTDVVTTFVGLSDTDDSYVGHAGHVVTVRTDETGLTYAALSGGAPLDLTLQAIADLVTSANTMAYFTGVDTAALTPLTPFIRTLLDDPDLATAQATLGITSGGGGGGGSTPSRRRLFMHMGS